MPARSPTNPGCRTGPRRETPVAPGRGRLGQKDLGHASATEAAFKDQHKALVGNCGGCHLNIPPQIQHDAKKSAEVVSCSYCGRILYWEAE